MPKSQAEPSEWEDTSQLHPRSAAWGDGGTSRPASTPGGTPASTSPASPASTPGAMPASASAGLPASTSVGWPASTPDRVTRLFVDDAMSSTKTVLSPPRGFDPAKEI